MRRAGLVLLLALAGPGPAEAADLTFAKPHAFLLWEDAGGFSDDVSGAEGPIQAVTDKGRSVQMVIDLMLDGEANIVFEVAPVLRVVVRPAAGDRPPLVDKAWAIQGVGDFGTVMRSIIVDHDCAGFVVEASIEEAGQIAERYEKRFDVVCG